MEHRLEMVSGEMQVAPASLDAGHHSSVKHFFEFHRFMNQRHEEIQWLKEFHTRKIRQRRAAVEECLNTQEHDTNERKLQIIKLTNDCKLLTNRKMEMLQEDLAEQELMRRQMAIGMSSQEKKKMVFQLEQLSKELDALWGGFCIVAEGMQNMSKGLSSGGTQAGLSSGGIQAGR
eukprot:TRINITY_DN114710_c0_g1_i1.p1 TRINITY_DN114710_c0_g1~~TRINITY_DN114710_c0_g1_i1.p1  ORF type:complete len:175 (+),score=47.68 TRINITY_DN114710_c0_g1_i1:83-607(+)